MSARLLRITNWEELALKARYNVGAMADLIPATPKSMGRFFKRRFHMTTKQWLREARCRKGMELLAQDLQNKEIVEALGFSDEAHLCHEFRRILGFSPQTFGPLLRVQVR